MEVTQKMKTRPYDPANPLLAINREKTIIPEDICTPMFIVALLTIGRTWTQPRCPSTDEWVKKMWYVYTMECSVHFRCSVVSDSATP